MHALTVGGRGQLRANAASHPLARPQQASVPRPEWSASRAPLGMGIHAWLINSSRSSWTWPCAPWRMAGTCGRWPRASLTSLCWSTMSWITAPQQYFSNGITCYTDGLIIVILGLWCSGCGCGKLLHWMRIVPGDRSVLRSPGYAHWLMSPVRSYRKIDHGTLLKGSVYYFTNIWRF